MSHDMEERPQAPLESLSVVCSLMVLDHFRPKSKSVGKLHHIVNLHYATQVEAIEAQRYICSFFAAFNLDS